MQVKEQASVPHEQFGTLSNLNYTRNYMKLDTDYYALHIKIKFWKKELENYWKEIKAS